jgi:hypothetical protein
MLADQASMARSICPTDEEALPTTAPTGAVTVAASPTRVARDEVPARGCKAAATYVVATRTTAAARIPTALGRRRRMPSVIGRLVVVMDGIP